MSHKGKSFSRWIRIMAAAVSALIMTVALATNVSNAWFTDSHAKEPIPITMASLSVGFNGGGSRGGGGGGGSYGTGGLLEFTRYGGAGSLDISLGGTNINVYLRIGLIMELLDGDRAPLLADASEFLSAAAWSVTPEAGEEAGWAMYTKESAAGQEKLFIYFGGEGGYIRVNSEDYPAINLTLEINPEAAEALGDGILRVYAVPEIVQADVGADTLKFKSGSAGTPHINDMGDFDWRLP